MFHSTAADDAVIYQLDLAPVMTGEPRGSTARAVGSAVLTGYGARDFRDLVGSGRLAEAIRQASC